MSVLQEAKVPDIGGSKGVPVIEVLIKVGDTVKKDEAAAVPTSIVEPVIKEDLPKKIESVLPMPMPVATEPAAKVATVSASNLVRTPPVSFDADGLMPANVPYASPSVRVFARELGVDLSKVKGSERGGRIAKADVQQFVKAALVSGVTGDRC